MNVGAAAVDITPDFVVDLCGFASRVQPSIGVLEPIFARAIYLESGDERLLWIACDIVAFDGGLVARFREWARRELKLEARQVLLSATHTHSAPATIHLVACGDYSERYVRLLRTRLEEVALRAAGKTQPCEFVCASSTLDLAIDRRNQPTAHVDPHVWGLGFRGRGTGAFIATVINYAMHPVAHGHVERRISPDWCGAAAFSATQRLPGRPITLVSNGAAGNINPPATDQPWETVQQYGRSVAEAIVPGLGSAKPQADMSLETQSITLVVPLDWMDAAAIDRAVDEQLAKIKPKDVWARPMGQALEDWRIHMKQQIAAGGGREVPIEVQIIRIGRTFIVAVNGEMFSRFTTGLREQSGISNLFVVAYANRAFGYIPTREAYAEGGYEVETAHYFYRSFRPAPGGLELLRDRAAAVIGEMGKSTARVPR